MMSWLKRSSLFVLAVTAVALIAGAASATVPLRSPQVAFFPGPLQTYLNSIDPGINVATDQLNAQAWSISFTGNADFTLMLKSALGTGAAFGVYDATQPVGPFPPLYQIFPGGAIAGWYAELHFISGGGLLVTQHNQFGVIVGQVTYPAITGSNFGFYIQSLGGDWFSQDSRNLPSPQMLTYGSPGSPGDFWLCWNVPPYDPGSATFSDVVIAVESVHPVPTKSVTWGAVKSTYHQ
jgi:hypothetical protein